VSGAAILAVAGVSGVISYGHIYDLSLALHQGVLAARLMPVAIDGLIVVGSVVLLESGSRLGWLGVGPGLALSVFANLESGLRFGALSAVWAAIPSLSFFLATFIFERWLTAQAAAVTTPATPDELEAVAAGPQGVPSVPGLVAGGVPEVEPVSVPARTVPTTHPSTRGTVASGRAPGRVSGRASRTPERVFAAELERGELPSLRAIKTRLHVGTDRARTILASLQGAVAVQAATGGTADI
jgi:hypothetical protein